MRQNLASSTLIVLSAALMALIAVLVYLVYNTYSNLRHDAYIINTSGIVRGSIQRLTKLELAGCDRNCAIVSDAIDDHIDELMQSESIYTNRASGWKFLRDVAALNDTWLTLKELLIRYREHPTDALKKEVIVLSEQCWTLADAAVYQAQTSTEAEVGYIRLFYPAVFSIVLCNTVMIFIVYSMVRKKLEYHAANDSLTGLYNRHSFEELLESEMARSKKYGRTFSIIVFDVDHFKRVNDTYGHQVGDEVLTELSEAIRSSVRKIDMISRIGGEEFSIIAPGTDLPDTLRLAEKIRRAVEKHAFPTNEGLTISLGVVEYDNVCSMEQFLGRADKALYQAKENGRNRVEYFTGQ